MTTQETPRTGITLEEYNRRWSLIMDTFYIGWLSAEDALAEIRKLTSMLVWR